MHTKKNVPPRRLPADFWARLRAEWEVSSLSNKAIAKKHGVTENAIKYRAIRENWQKKPPIVGPDLEIHIRNRITELLAQRAVAPAPTTPQRRGPPDPVALPDDPRIDYSQMPLEELQALAKDRLAQVAAEAFLRDIDRIRKQEDVVDEMLKHARVIILETDKRKVVESSSRLLSEKTDLIGAVRAIASISESIQTQRRRALGLEDAPRRVELSGPQGGAIVTEAREVIDLSKIPTQQLEDIYKVALILEGVAERPPVPTPPTGPSE